MPVAVLVCAGGIVLTVYTIHEEFAVQRGLLFALFAACAVVLVGMILLRLCTGSDHGFDDLQLQAYLLYVRNMFSGVQRARRAAELARWRQEFADKEQAAAEKAEAAGA